MFTPIVPMTGLQTTLYTTPSDALRYIVANDLEQVQLILLDDWVLGA